MRAAFIVIGGLFTLVAVLAQVSAETAMSNLQTWVEFLGVQDVPAWAAGPNADKVATAIAIVGALISFGIALWLRKKSQHVRAVPANDVLARALAVAKITDGRLKYVTRVLEEDKDQDIEKWLKKVDDQRIDFSHVISTETNTLAQTQKMALTESHLRHRELERCIDNILARRNYETPRHAAGLYAQRARKFSVALGILIAELEGKKKTLRMDVYPDWTIRELFFHVRPDILETDQQDVWNEVRLDVHDKLATGQLKAWGRRVNGKERPLTEIETDYWRYADLFLGFLDPDGEGDKVVHAMNRQSNRNYSDIHVSRNQVMMCWPNRQAD